MGRRKREVCTPERPPEADELIRSIFVSDYKSLEMFAYSKLRNHQLAETAVQEAFILALEKYDSFWESADPLQWLYKAVKYICLHTFREQQYLKQHTLPLDERNDLSLGRWDTYSEIPSEVAESEEMRMLREFYLGGYTVRELAAKYGIAAGACKMRLLRARQKLAKKLR